MVVRLVRDGRQLVDELDCPREIVEFELATQAVAVLLPAVGQVAEPGLDIFIAQNGHLLSPSMPTHSLVIEAEPGVCFDTITDYETFPEWQAAVKEVDVLSVDDQGRGRDVRFHIDAKVRQVSYTLRYSYERPHSITWD